MALTQLTTAQVDNAINALDPIFHRAQPNGDEANGALKKAGNFHKTLQHDSTAYVDSTRVTNYVSALTAAQRGGTFNTLDAALPAFSSKSERLTNPAAGLAEDIMGIDPRLMPFAPAPSVTSEQCAVEMKE